MNNERACANNVTEAKLFDQFETDAMILVSFLEGLEIMIEESDRTDDVGRKARNAAILMLAESIKRADKLTRELGAASLNSSESTHSIV